ncbi:MAG TPA: thiol-activated cytolysin family protein [Ferruginibacter sp.]|nr:thiol-activated cytolysin family protein [Ferruginibacter sp.]
MKKYLISFLALVCLLTEGFGQTKIVLKPIITGVNYSTLQVADIISGAYKGYSYSQRLGLLGQVKNRYKSMPLASSSQKQGTGKNGLVYYVSRNALSLPASSAGATTTRRQPQDILICESSPVKSALNLTEALFLGGKYNFNTTNIFPGVLLKDDEVVKGIFNPVTTLQRKPSSIFIDVLNSTGGISQQVSDLNKRDVVREATNTLLAQKVGNAIPPVINDQFSFEIRSHDEFSLKSNASMDVDLTALLELPVAIGQDIGAAASLTTDFNAAVASIQNIYYTVSLGGEGPSSTVNGTIPSNLLCVTDVAYGTVAYIFVIGAKTRLDASITANRLLEIAEIGSATQTLSAEVQRLVEGKTVRIHVYGGVNSQTVANVTDLTSLRNAMSKMNPTVLQNGALPLFYNLRYASDNAPAQIGAFADFTDTRCFKADKLDIKIVHTKLTKNAELDGNEELYGHIYIAADDFKGNSTIDDRDFWEKSRSASVKKGQGETISMDNQTITFNVNPALVNPESEIITLTINVKDKIEDGPEYLGASSTAKVDGFVQYNNKRHSVSFADIKDAPNGILTKTFKVTEGSSEVEVRVEFKLRQ